MEYVVLARKLRPQRFQDLVGQELAGRALRNAIRSGRLAHAYLFAGSRGVGKTSSARILTKAFNCLDLQDGEPCNACEHCIEISNNASPDVFEIDAASNRGIDNIRELRENTKYAPAKCRFKTYIIDEVHMLTQESFNALLKTLEEPPPHVKFILATTHPHRIPDTILSRCQRFDFARISLARMADYLEKATAAEGLTISRHALESIARNSAGGMRDALTMVDQVVAFAGPKPTDEDVLGLLRLLDHGEVRALFEALLAQDVNGALEGFGRIVSAGHELHHVLEALLREVKDLTLYGVLGGENAYFADHLAETLHFFEEKKSAATLDQLQQMFHVLLDLEGQLRSTGHARACFEMALVKACRVQPLVGVPELMNRARELLRSGGGGTGGGPSRVASMAAPAPLPRAPLQQSAPPRITRSIEPSRPAEPTPAAAAPVPSPSPVQSAASPAPASIRTAPPTPPEVTRPAPASAAPPPTAAITPPAPPRAARPEPEEGDDPAKPAPCDDPRWAALVQAVGQKGRHLWSRITHTDVLRIEGAEVEAMLFAEDGGAAKPLSTAEQAQVLEAGQQTFGSAFRLTWIDATPEVYRARRSVAGRKTWREDRAHEKEKAAAEADPAVQTLRKAFPGSKVVSVQLADTPARTDESQR